MVASSNYVKITWWKTVLQISREQGHCKQLEENSKNLGGLYL